MKSEKPQTQLKFLEDALCCPVCGNNYTHQGAVHVYHRREEDAIEGLSVSVDGLLVVANTDADFWNPSRRRNGLTIDFECEGCDREVRTLSILQHKGQTFMRWDWDEPKEDAGPEPEVVTRP